jgi:hypothetical protein
MVSFRHESVLELVRESPAFAAELAGLAHARVPGFREARAVDPTLTQAVPVELHADSLVVLAADKPVLGVIIESQLQRDERKRYTWPAYATVARARHECPCVVVVVTPSASVAEWASGVVELGCGEFRALVLGPAQVPKITEREAALESPELTMLSLYAHSDGDEATLAKIVEAAYVVAKQEQDESRQALYWGLIQHALQSAKHEVLKMKLSEMKFPPSGYVQGRAEGRAESLLRVLKRRGIAVNDEQRRRVETCVDISEMNNWLDRAAVATSIDDVLAP